jgi:hypothetical protein
VGTGSIASDGSMSGTTQGYDASSGQTLPYNWTAPAGSADPAFHFTSPVNCVNFLPANSAVFSATIPADSGGPGSVLGQPYAVKVVDNGEPGTSDTYSHNLGNCSQTAFTGYTVTSGNIQVKR